ncbi:MAG TPA: DUF421 domain-containing protein [Phycisphaerae bacterium]|jgi:uncharacterized membrane protein YcaP (DUF421 family)|nr:DUF421 domain-containing protein [Phycisphaerae bacterium]HOB74327.1 DUF421 domain-containing protein [Phycisphaerae bacterium]HOJ53082.1 DUF421 domain-containing protein [Phycisphaerae bacterium]HOL24819.1 DUF421 domain-containing protein [Phycisphaerae bacterium]HPP19355.1 DUF421 domain-containing protein [Phycisphaerae bacterium]
MDSILRAVAVYLFLLLIFRIAGRRTLAEMTSFDFVLLLVISETTQQALIGNDFSVTTAGILILTLIGLDIGISLIKEAYPRFEKWIDGVPIILIEDGHIHQDRMKKARVDEADILTNARRLQGIERLDQIKYAVLERSGGISIIPRNQG